MAPTPGGWTRQLKGTAIELAPQLADLGAQRVNLGAQGFLVPPGFLANELGKFDEALADVFTHLGFGHFVSSLFRWRWRWLRRLGRLLPQPPPPLQRILATVQDRRALFFETAPTRGIIDPRQRLTRLADNFKSVSVVVHSPSHHRVECFID